MIHAVDSESAQCKLAKTNEKIEKENPVEKEKRNQERTKQKDYKEMKTIKVTCHF